MPYANIAKFCPQDEASLSDNDESGVDVRIFFSTLEIFSDVFWMLEIPDKANMRCYRLFYVGHFFSRILEIPEKANMSSMMLKKHRMLLQAA